MSDYIKREVAEKILAEAIKQAEENTGCVIVDTFTGWSSIESYAKEAMSDAPTADVEPKGAIAESLNILYDELDTDDEKYYVRGYQDALEDVYEDLVSDTVPRDEVEVTAHKDRIGKLVEIATGAKMDGEEHDN